MMKKLLLASLLLVSFSFVRASYILVPMDNAQTNHLKAYGIAFQSLKAQNTVQWLLNYRGGAFLLAENDANEALLKTAGVAFDRLDDNTTQGIITTILTGNNGMNLVTMSRLPKIAVYTPPYDRHYDDAVILALNYAGIDYTPIYDSEVLSQDLSQYDWIHLDHEDFTGQFNKWQSMYAGAGWFKSQVAYSDSIAKACGYAKSSQMKLAVAKKLRSFVENGGQLFTMCAGTETLDVALAAEGVDIVPWADGDAADSSANSKLNFSNTFAFQNFTVNTDAYSYDHSNMGVRQVTKSPQSTFTVSTVDAKLDLVGAMLVQNHQTTIKEFLGNTIAFKKEFIKPSVQVLGGTAADVKYLHGQRGAGYFTFYAGHDPECYMHLVGDPATNLDKYKTSPGYRLILNNVLSPAVTDNTLGVSNLSLVNVKVYPNPVATYFSVEVSSSDAKQAAVSVYNLSGQVFITDNVSSDNGTFSRQYNTENLAAGLYIVEISNARGAISKTVLTKAGNN